MINFIQESSVLLTLILSVLCLLFVFILLRKSKKRKFSIEKDKTGYWRYHKETQFTKKDSYGDEISGEKSKKSKKSKIDKAGSDENSKETAVAVIKFNGDIKAKQHGMLAELVDEVEVNRESFSEIVVCVTSPGGSVPQYGHAYAQMARLRGLGIPLTVCIDTVAASGGYLMALPANKIIAAPFAFVGSIGVMAFIPNIRRLLENWQIEPRTFTAGKFKRTVTLTDDATPEETAHFQEQLEAIHQMFSAAVAEYRSDVDVDLVTTGDHWTAQDSIKSNLGLVDRLGTSNEYLLQLNKSKPLVYLSQKKGFLDGGLSLFTGHVADRIEERLAPGRAGSLL